MHVLPPALAFALGLALAADGQAVPAKAAGAGDPGEPAGSSLYGPVLMVFDGDGAVADMVEASGVAEALAAIEHNAAAATGPLLVLLVPVASDEWEVTCARASVVRASAVVAWQAEGEM